MSSPSEPRQPPATPSDSPLTIEDVSSSPLYRELSTPKLRVGDPAFDFELPILDDSRGRELETEKSFRLGGFAGSQPVALIFGSYT